MNDRNIISVVRAEFEETLASLTAHGEGSILVTSKEATVAVLEVLDRIAAAQPLPKPLDITGVVRKLFTAGNGVVVDRLVQRGSERDLGGWSEPAMARFIQQELESARSAPTRRTENP